MNKLDNEPGLKLRKRVYDLLEGKIPGIPKETIKITIKDRYTATITFKELTANE